MPRLRPQIVGILGIAFTSSACLGAESVDAVREDDAPVEDRASVPEAIESHREDQELAAARVAERRELLDRTKSMNVVLIVVDALRADLLTDTEANRRDLPNLLRLRDESRWFDRAFAPGAGTDVSMAGAFTGRINPWENVETTLAEALKEAGRRTHAVVPNEVFYFAGRTLLTRGFDHPVRLRNDPVERNVSSFASSERTTQLASRFLHEWAEAYATQPFFSWIHYFDVHEHHQIPTGDRRLLSVTGGRRGRTPQEKYRALAQLVDKNVGALLEDLRASGRLDDTIVVLMSDHGEGLRTDSRLPDHHGQFIYNSLVHVPLAIRIPGVAPRTIDQPVSLIDVYPTLIELAGTTPSEPADGVSLVPHLLETEPGEASEPRVLPLNEVEHFGVVQWPYKLVVRREDGAAEVYDLSTDWEEQHDLASTQPELVGRLRRVYDTLPPVVVDRTRKNMRAHELAARKQ